MSRKSNISPKSLCIPKGIAVMNKVVLVCLSTFVVFIITGYMIWKPAKINTQVSGTEHNGLWVGHSFYSGITKEGLSVNKYEFDLLEAKIRKYRMKYVFIHVGLFNGQSLVIDKPSDKFNLLRSRTPGVMYLPWISGKIGSNEKTNSAFLDSVAILLRYGFKGIHLALEPIEDQNETYLELLRQLRLRNENTFFISCATRRLIPVDIISCLSKKWYWSQVYYKKIINIADQIVLMSYDTGIHLRKLYVYYTRFQIQNLLCLINNDKCKLMVGIPAYDGTPHLSNKKIENIPNALLGVKAAVQNDSGRSFHGVAVYAEWFITADEWEQFSAYWLSTL